jgi:hypothetical protein
MLSSWPFDVNFHLVIDESFLRLFRSQIWSIMMTSDFRIASSLSAMHFQYQAWSCWRDNNALNDSDPGCMCQICRKQDISHDQLLFHEGTLEDYEVTHGKSAYYNERIRQMSQIHRTHCFRLWFTVGFISEFPMPWSVTGTEKCWNEINTFERSEKSFGQNLTWKWSASSILSLCGYDAVEKAPSIVATWKIMQ